MKHKRTGTIAMATCITFSALMTVQAMAQPGVGSALGGGGSPGAMGSAFSSDSMSSGSRGEENGEMSASSEQGDGCMPCGSESGQDDSSSDQTLPGLELSSPQEGESAGQGQESESPLAGSEEDDGDEQPNRFDGGITVRQETRGEEFTPPDGGFADLRNPSFFERHTVAEDHGSVRTCVAAGEVCLLEFDVIVASEESQHDTAVMVNDEQTLPPPEE